MEWVEGQTAPAESAPQALALLCTVTKQTQYTNQEYINCVTLQHLFPLALSSHNHVILEQILIWVHIWLSLKFTIFINLSLLMMTSIVLILAACRMPVRNSVKWPCSPWVLVAQWIEHPLGVLEVIGSFPVGDSECFFVPCSRHVDLFTFTIIILQCSDMLFAFHN